MDWTKTVPPMFQVRNAIQCPAPCMNGGSEQCLQSAICSGDDSVERLRLRATEALDVGVAVAPQHALGHARGAAGVEDVEVVRAPLDGRLVGRRSGERILVPDGARQQVVAGFVGHLEDDSQVGEVGEHLGERRRELGVHDDRGGPRIVEQVAQLLGDVAVVDVERRDTGLERAEHRLEVLVAVVQVDREVVLAALVAGELRPLGVHAEPGVDQVVGQAPRALGHVGPREPAVAEDEALLRRVGVAAIASWMSATENCMPQPREAGPGHPSPRIAAETRRSARLWCGHEQRSSSVCSCRRAGRWSCRASTAPQRSGTRRSTSRCSPRTWATTRSGSTTTSTTCPGRRTRPCSSAGPRWPRSASCTSGSGSGRWSAATATASRACSPRSPRPSTSSPADGSTGASAPGWYENEYKGYGFEFPRAEGSHRHAARERRDRAGACGRKPETTYDGKYYKLSRANCDPKPLQSPAPADLDRWRRRAADAARRRPTRRLQQLRWHARGVGAQARDPEGPLRCGRTRRGDHPQDVVAGDVHPLDRGRVAGAGQPQPVGRAVRQVAEPTAWSARPSRSARRSQTYVDLGCTGFIPWCSDYPDTESMDLFATEVMPNFR